MSLSTALIFLIGIGNFIVLIWFRDRVVRWRALLLSVLSLPIFGALIIPGTVVGNIAGWIDLSFEMTAIELTNRSAQLVLICGVFLLLTSLLPTGVSPVLDRMLSDPIQPDDNGKPGDSTEQ